MGTLRKVIHSFFELYRPKSNTLHVVDPLTAFGLGVGALKTLGGLFQRNKAKKLKESDQISPELAKAEAEANQLANATKAPGQAQEEANVRQSTSRAISDAKKVAGGANEILNYASAAQGTENKAMRDVSRRALLYRDQARKNRAAIRQQIASQRAANRQQFQAAKSALLGASNQNIFGGLTDMGGTLALNASGGGNSGSNPLVWGRNGQLGIPNAQ